jgi:hypothetical protein
MKKIISITSIAAGVLAIVSAIVAIIKGVIFTMNTSGFTGIIGGAGAPTIMLLVRTLNIPGIIISIIIGIILVAVGIWGLKKAKK